MLHGPFSFGAGGRCLRHPLPPPSTSLPQGTGSSSRRVSRVPRPLEPRPFEAIRYARASSLLSNMPPSIPEAHRALVDGDACKFLAKIVIDSPQETWSWKDRAIWRVKGEAITCLGNIIEKMDEKELRSRLGEEVIKAIAHIRDNDEAPLAQRDQGTFTLRRYKAAADHCCVVPFCKEILVHEPGGSNGGEVRSV